MSALLFIHGSGFTGDAFKNQLEYFSGSEAPNLPGHGSPGAPQTVSEFADFVESHIAQRRRNDVVLCGHSLGGAIALEVALRNPQQVRAVVLLGSGARLRVAPAILAGLAQEFERTVEELAAHMVAQPAAELLTFTTQSMKAVGKEQTLRDFIACDAFDVTNRLAELLVPLLALTGEQDVMTPPKYARFLADRVPKGEVRIVPGAGHLVMLERPAETNDAIADFVQEAGNPRS